MISSNEYILVYNQLFIYVHRDYGKGDVFKLWDGIKSNCKDKLDRLTKEKGLKGIYKYWKETMAQEGGKYKFTLWDDEYVFDMHYCPSMGKLLNTHVEPYEDYCGHCPPIYPPIIEKYGFKVDYHIIDQNTGQCRIYVRKKKY